MTIAATPILLAVGSALAYSGLDLLRKLLSGRARPMPLLFYMAAGPVPLFLIWLLAGGGGGVAATYWLPGGVSVVLNIGANLAFLEAVRVSPLNLTIPLLSLSPVFTSLLAMPILGEYPTPAQLAGIGAVVVGAFRLNLATGGDGSAVGLWRSFVREKGCPLMALTALLWSLATPLDKIALASSSVPFHAMALNAGVALGVLAVLAAQGRLSELAGLRRHGALLTLTIVVSVAGLGLFLTAISRVWVGLVETLKRGIGSLLALVLGGLFFGERTTPSQLLAVLLMVAGAVLILS
ncbi:MAG: DMT family transporter [Thermoanaerobaculia bacterium]